MGKCQHNPPVSGAEPTVRQTCLSANIAPTETAMPQLMQRRAFTPSTSWMVIRMQSQQCWRLSPWRLDETTDSRVADWPAGDNCAVAAVEKPLGLATRLPSTVTTSALIFAHSARLPPWAGRIAAGFADQLSTDSPDVDCELPSGDTGIWQARSRKYPPTASTRQTNVAMPPKRTRFIGADAGNNPIALITTTA